MYHRLSASLLWAIFLLLQLLTTINGAVLETSEVMKWQKNKVAVIFKILLTAGIEHEVRLFFFFTLGKGQGFSKGPIAVPYKKDEMCV